MAIDNYGASKKPAINVRKYVGAGPPSPYIAAGPPSPITGALPTVQPYPYFNDPAKTGAETLARVAGKAKSAANAAFPAGSVDPAAEYMNMVSGGGSGGVSPSSDPGFVDPGFSTAIYDQLRGSVADQGKLNADAIAKAFLDLNANVDSRKADYQTASDAATSKIGAVGVDTSGFGTLDSVPDAVKAQYLARASQNAQLQQELGARMGQVTQGGLTDLKGIGDLVRQVTDQQLAASTRQQNSSIDQKQAADQQAYNQWLAEQQASAAAAASARRSGGGGSGGGSGGGYMTYEQYSRDQQMQQDQAATDQTDTAGSGEATTYDNPQLWDQSLRPTGWLDRALYDVKQKVNPSPYGTFNISKGNAQILSGSGLQGKELNDLAKQIGADPLEYYRLMATSQGVGAPTVKRTANADTKKVDSKGKKSVNTSTQRQTAVDKRNV